MREPVPPPDELPLDVPEGGGRRRVRRRQRRVQRRRAAAEPVLFEAPVNQECGLCGHRLTVLESATTCPGCGAVVMRSMWEEPPL